MATRGACVAHVCRVARLLSYKFVLIRISTAPSDMGDACSLLSFCRSAIHYIHMRFMTMFNYDYLVVENDDTKNG
jgi:hypothetical protein